MPETNYKAAVNVIERWENEFPDTFEKLKKEIEPFATRFLESASGEYAKSYKMLS